MTDILQSVAICVLGIAGMVMATEITELRHRVSVLEDQVGRLLGRRH